MIFILEFALVRPSRSCKKYHSNCFYSNTAYAILLINNIWVLSASKDLFTKIYTKTQYTEVSDRRHLIWSKYESYRSFCRSFRRKRRSYWRYSLAKCRLHWRFWCGWFRIKEYWCWNSNGVNWTWFFAVKLQRIWQVAGIVSGASGYKPAIVLDRQEQDQKSKDRLPIALMGKVYCKVDARYSSIEIGDLLTTSTTKGYVMKVDDPAKAFGAVSHISNSKIHMG